MGVSSLGWVGGWNLKALLTFVAVIWSRGFRWAGGKSRAAPCHSSRGTRRDSHLEQEHVPCPWTHLQYIYASLWKATPDQEPSKNNNLASLRKQWATLVQKESQPRGQPWSSALGDGAYISHACFVSDLTQGSSRQSRALCGISDH